MTLTTQPGDMTNEGKVFFSVVHPLDDAPEEKAATEHLGPMQMTRTVTICLLTLRCYLLLMLGLLGYRVLQLAGTIRP
jgi:hypothetical protein